MNIKIDIDCTPEEARAFLGLPNVAPMQEAVMQEVQKQMMANLQALDPETLFKTWVPASIQGWLGAGAEDVLEPARQGLG
jgi:hypothetical protein